MRKYFSLVLVLILAVTILPACFHEEDETADDATAEHEVVTIYFNAEMKPVNADGDVLTGANNVHAHEGGLVQIVNQSEHEAVVSFTSDAIFGATGFTIPAGGSVTVQVKSGAGESSPHVYGADNGAASTSGSGIATPHVVVDC